MVSLFLWILAGLLGTLVITRFDNGNESFWDVLDEILKEPAILFLSLFGPFVFVLGFIALKDDFFAFLRKKAKQVREDCQDNTEFTFEDNFDLGDDSEEHH